MILKAKVREKFGKKARIDTTLVPAVCYGHDVPNQFVYVDPVDFKIVFSKVGRSEIFSLEIEKANHQVLIKEISFHPVDSHVQHIDFYLVNVKEEIETSIPIVFNGESPAVKNLGGILFEVLHSVSIKCLPKFLPKEIKIDLSTLIEIGSVIKISDLKLDSHIVIIEDENEVIVSISKQEEDKVEEVEEKVVTDTKSENIDGKKSN